jgi:lysophospholipase L1-like esterase
MWASGAYGYLFDYLWWWGVVISLVLHTWCFFCFFPRTRWPKIRLILGNILVFASLLSFAGLVGETYVRFLVVETDSYGASLVSKRWFDIYPKLNSLYCRDHEWAEGKQPRLHRIAFVGDSFTYGWGINDPSDRFTDIIQSRLDARTPGQVEVMNVAWSGWGTREHINAVHDMIQDYVVDEIVLCHVPNDMETLLPVTPGFDPKLPPRSRYLNTEHSFLLNYLYHRVIAPFARGANSYWDWLADGYADPAIWARQEAQFAEILELCRSHNVRLRVVLLPFLRTSGQRYDASEIQSKVRAFFDSRGIQVVDLLPLFAGQNTTNLVVNSHDPHPNEAANRLFADAIWDAYYAKEKNKPGSE